MIINLGNGVKKIFKFNDYIKLWYGLFKNIFQNQNVAREKIQLQVKNYLFPSINMQTWWL